MGSMPMVTAPALNRAMTAPGMGGGGAGPAQNIHQLTATVAQLQSHFCAILQHLPLTTSQQNQLLSAPNSVNDASQNIGGPTPYPMTNAQPMLPMVGAPMFAVTNQPLMAQPVPNDVFTSPPPIQYRHSDP